jgi:hypothetical protein
MKRFLRPDHPPVCVTARRQSWPQGATAGLLLVAATCLGFAATLYQVAGPRNVFAAEVRAH